MDARIKSGHDESTFSNSQIVIARSEATKQSISPRKEKMDCAEPVIGAHSRDPLARNGDPRRHALNPSARRPCESRDPYAALYRFFWRAVRDLSFQRTPVVMGPCFRRDDVRELDLSNPIRLCPRGAMRPRRCIYFSAQERAWGMPGARCTRSLVCTCSGRKHTSNNEYTGITRHSRTQWF